MPRKYTECYSKKYLLRQPNGTKWMLYLFTLTVIGSLSKMSEIILLLFSDHDTQLSKINANICSIIFTDFQVKSNHAIVDEY